MVSVILEVNEAGCVIVTYAVVVHPLASVGVTEIVPAHKLVAVESVAPSAHE